MNLKFPLTILLLFSFLFLRSQNIDSLWLKYGELKGKNDTTILNVVYEISKQIKYKNPDTTIYILKKGLQVSKKNSNYDYVPYYYELMGDAYWQLIKYNNAITSYENALKEYLAQGQNVNAGYVYSNIAYTLMDMGKYEKAFNTLKKALDIAESERDKSLEMLSLNYLSDLYSNMGQPKKSIDTYRKTLKYYIENQHPKNVQVCLNNIGVLFLKLNQLDSAKTYFKKSIDVGKQIGDEKNIANGLLNLGSIFYKKKEFKKAHNLYKESLDYNIKRADESQLFKCYINLCNTSLKLKLIDDSFNYISKAKEIAVASGNIKSISSVYSTFSQYYKLKKDYKTSLDYFEKHIELEDSILSLEQTKQMNELSAKYENERKELEISNLEKDKQLRDALLSENETKLKQEGVFRMFLLSGVVFLIVFAGFIFKSYKNKSKAHQIISAQKTEVERAHSELEEKNQEILDSINYAKRIQSAILPPENIVKEYLNESFILYKPKDIVAGDFYWLEYSNNKVLFAAADCTGHGVPGAMVSVVCVSGLNRSVREYGLTDPGEILDKTREIVIQEFEKSVEEVKDGMDIALCCFEGNKLQFAGAHNPLWIIRNGEVIETKANKQPIGKFYKPESFITHSFELEKGDSLYVFTDGYVDQFGGEKGKKFKAKAFRELLLSIQDKSMEEQKHIIDDTFESWKGDLEQIDDVCVIGVRV